MDDAEKEMTTSLDTKPDKAGEWIADLFCPKFDIETVVRAAQNKETRSDDVDKIARWNALDPENIKKLYERVRLINILDQEIQKQKCDKIIPKGRQSKENVEKSLQFVEQSQQSNLINSQRNVYERQLLSTDDLQISLIWDSEELEVLRKVYKSAKDEISNLKVKLCESEKRNKHLENSVKKFEYALEKNSSELTEAKKSNKRLKIHCDNLQYQLNHSSAKLDTVTDMWKEIDKEKTKMMKEVHEMKIEHEKALLMLKNANLRLENEMREKERSIDLAIQNTKLKYAQQLMNLREELKQQTEDFQKAKQEHSVTSKSLKHLRNHFSSLPLSNIIPPQSVTEDEVSFIDHVS